MFQLFIKQGAGFPQFYAAFWNTHTSVSHVRLTSLSSTCSSIARSVLLTKGYFKIIGVSFSPSCGDKHG